DGGTKRRSSRWRGSRARTGGRPSLAVLCAGRGGCLAAAREAVDARGARGCGRHLPEVRERPREDCASALRGSRGLVRVRRRRMAVFVREHQPCARSRCRLPAIGARALARASGGGNGWRKQRRSIPLPTRERLAPHDPRSRRRTEAQRVADHGHSSSGGGSSAPGFTVSVGPAILARSRRGSARGIDDRRRSVSRRVAIDGPEEVGSMPSLTEDAVGVRSVGSGLAALLRWIRPTFDLAPGARPVLDIGYFANVVPVSDTLGIAISTDGVGTKLRVAEAAGNFDSVGIDCVAMNVNDVLCVGARPVALVDYIAVEEADPELLGPLGQGIALGCEQAGVSCPGGELAQVREMIRGVHPGRGVDLVGTAIGTVPLDRVLTGAAVEPGDVLLGLESSGLHSNGFTLARRALLEQG